MKTRIRAQEIFARDSAHGRAYEYGQGLATGLSVQDVNDWPAILEAVTAEDVMAAARAVLRPEGSVTGWLLPAEAAEAPPADPPATDPALAEPAEQSEVQE